MTSIIPILPGTQVECRLDSHLWIPSGAVETPAVVKALEAIHIKDPRWNPGAGSYEAGTGPWIEPWIESDGCARWIGIERGVARPFIKAARDGGVAIQILDNRSTQPVTWPGYNGPSLRPYQESAITRGIRNGCGIAILPTGSGKTLTALELARRLGQKTLIITPRNGLSDQWAVEAVEKFGLSPDDIGQIGSGNQRVGRLITTAHPQSLVGSGLVQELGLERRFGTVILDECQYGAAPSFRAAVTSLHARYRYGVSADPSRQDGIERLVSAIFGPVLIRRSREDSESAGAVLPVMLRIWPYRSHRVLPRGVANRERALLSDAERMAELDHVIALAPKPTLVVCRLRESVDKLVSHYSSKPEFRDRVGRMVGQQRASDKRGFRDAMTGLQNGELDLAIATWSACGVGTNIPGLRSLVMATPPGRGERGYLAYNQNRGRASRLANGKERGEVYLLWDQGRVKGVASQCWEWNDERAEIWTGTGWREVVEMDLIG